MTSEGLPEMEMKLAYLNVMVVVDGVVMRGLLVVAKLEMVVVSSVSVDSPVREISGWVALRVNKVEL